MKFIQRILLFLHRIPRNLRYFVVNWLWQVSTFSLLLFIYLTKELLTIIIEFKFTPPPLRMVAKAISVLVDRILRLLNPYKEDTIDRISLIDLAIKNMKFKKSRAFITVGGMALGIGAIVFLVSLGYGVNQLVIDRVARLEEMMQTDVLPQPGSQLTITDQTIGQFKDLTYVSEALPMIAVVAKVNFQNSVSDMAVYGVTSQYLEQSAIKPTIGKIFDSNELAVRATGGVVAGLSTEQFSQTDITSEAPLEPDSQHVEYEIHGGTWLRVREKPITNSKIIGYTRRVEGKQTGVEVEGDAYTLPNTSKKESSLWIESTVPLWKNVKCDEAPCEEGQYVPIIDSTDEQEKRKGYVAQIDMNVSKIKKNHTQVLGISTLSEQNALDLVLGLQDEATVAAAVGSSSETDSGDGWIEIASESAVVANTEVKQVAFSPQAKKEAVVNTSMLQVLGISETDAIGKTFETTFVVVENLLDTNQKIQSIPTNYTIVGVIPDNSSPFFYVPFVDLRGLGITNYSQVKVTVDNKSELSGVRRQIEALGFSSSSVADTVEQIDNLFATIRSVLALLGMVALAVASLGMFNTLTVSLLERTREVGLMKAMGMKSHEVRELFLTESMIMGFFGGLSGILLGYIAGKLLSIALSTFSIVQGQGVIDVSHIPAIFVVVIFLLSLIVGIFTGIYPARRATKISALNALRYE